MSTVQEIPSPTVSIPYSFLPRNSEDTGHARSSSAPGEFVRDSQTLPSARIDLSKPQWTSKQADKHPAKGLGLSMPASVSVDRLDQKRGPPNPKQKPNLTIEIKKDARLKPKAVIVRDEDLPGDDDMPPPPPPKSPRHDSRNQSLNNIQYDPRKARRTQSRSASQSSKQSHSSPDSAHPSEEATIASQGSFVKAALVDTPSPSSSPALSKPVIQHDRQGSYSPLSGDVRIKELMAQKSEDGQDDLDRPIPPPITPGQPRVASMARVMSIPSLPKSVSVEKPVVKQIPEKGAEKPGISQTESKSTDTIVPIKPAPETGKKAEHTAKGSESAAEKPKPVKQGSQSDSQATNSPASTKPASTKTTKLNLDKPMPSLPPPSSRFSEHMRQVRAAEGPKSEDAPPVPPVQTDIANAEARKDSSKDERPQTGDRAADSAPPQGKTGRSEAEQTKAANSEAPKQEDAARTVHQGEGPPGPAPRGPPRGPKGPSLSAFPSVPPPPQYYPRGTRGDSPSGRPPMGRPPPPLDMRQRGPPPRDPRDASPARRFPPGHPMHRPGVAPLFIPAPPHPPREQGQGPPRSRFYGRQPETGNDVQTSPIDHETKPDVRKDEATRENMTSPEPNLQAKSPASMPRPSPGLVQTPPIEQRNTPILETESSAEKDSKQPRTRTESDGKEATPEAKSSHLQPSTQQDHLKRPQSPANLSRAPSPTPSQRPSSAGDLLNKASGDKSLPSLPHEMGPRPTTPDAISVLTMDTKATIFNPMQTLRDLTKQSEALHARHASLRADRLKLSTAISASLKDSKPGPEYANALLDQHLSLNAINSSLDICFAKLKSLDCKKEEAIQALIEQTKEKQMSLGSRRHKASSSTATHSTQASISGHSSKASTPDIGSGPLSPLQERDSRVSGSLGSIDVGESATAKGQDGEGQKGHSAEKSEGRSANEDSRRASLTDGLPTPRPIIPPKPAESVPSSTEPSPVDPSSTTSPQAKRNTMVKMPTVSPAPSLFTKEPVDMSPVSPIEAQETDADNDSPADAPKRITVKGAKAAKILGLVATDRRPESPSGITLPDDSPTESRKDFAVEVKIHRKPVPGSAHAPPARQAPVPPQPGRKRTNDSASTVQTESSPESEVRTPRASQEGLMPKGLKIGKKGAGGGGVGGVQMQQRPPPQQPVQVVSDEDILDYYAR